MSETENLAAEVEAAEQEVAQLRSELESLKNEDSEERAIVQNRNRLHQLRNEAERLRGQIEFQRRIKGQTPSEVEVEPVPEALPAPPKPAIAVEPVEKPSPALDTNE